MSSTIKNIKNKAYQRQEKAGLLERLGAQYYRFLCQQSGTFDLPNSSIDDLPADPILKVLARNITAFAAIIAFAVGALTTFVTIWVEWTYQGTMSDTLYYLLYGSVLLVMMAIEMAVLFWLSLNTVYSLACLTGHNHGHTDSKLPVDDAVPNILARAALEVPDPIIHYLGIDPLKHLSKSKLVFVALLYKAKVLLTSLLVKFILIRFFGKAETRAAFSWVAIPITGLWDAFTIYKVAREARLRLFGHKLAEHITDKVLTTRLINQLSPEAHEGAIRAVATMMVLAQNYHPNMLVLLIKLGHTFEVDEDCDYDNWDDLLVLLDKVSEQDYYFLLDLLSVAAAFDGYLSRLERHHLPEAFKDLTPVYLGRSEQLRVLLMNGELHAAKAHCKLDFIPG